MATVPVTKRTVLDQPAQRIPFADPRNVSAQSFGALEGRAIAQLGNQTVETSDLVFTAGLRLQEDANQREFKKLDVEFQDYVHKISYGTPEQPGVLSLEGEHALAALPKAKEAIEKKRKELLESASTDRVAGMFDPLSADRQSKTFAGYVSHGIKEERKANDAADISSIVAERMNASTAWTDPSYMEASYVRNSVAWKNMGLRNGLKEEDIARKIREEDSKTTVQVMEAAIAFDLDQAKVLFSKYADRLDGSNRALMYEKMYNKGKELRAQKEHQELMDRQANERRKEDNATQLLAQLYDTDKDGKPLISIATIRDNLYKSNITFAHARGLEQELHQIDKVVTDPDKLFSAEINISYGEVITESGDRQPVTFEWIKNLDGISRTDKSRLMTLQREMMKNGGIHSRWDVKQARQEIEDIVIGKKEFGAKWDFAESRRMHGAMNEWNRRLAEVPARELTTEMVQKIKNDIVDAFPGMGGKTFDADLQSLPVPKGMTGRPTGSKDQMMEQVRKGKARLTGEYNGIPSPSDTQRNDYFRALDQYKSLELLISRKP